MTQKKALIPHNWSYRWLGITVWVLELQPRSSARTSALSHRLISPAIVFGLKEVLAGNTLYKEIFHILPIG